MDNRIKKDVHVVYNESKDGIVLEDRFLCGGGGGGLENGLV